MVDEEARRSGIGRSLMRQAEQWSLAMGAAYLGLASRRAGSFYRALDYQDAATFYKKSLSAQNG